MTTRAYVRTYARIRGHVRMPPAVARRDIVGGARGGGSDPALGRPVGLLVSCDKCRQVRSFRTILPGGLLLYHQCVLAASCCSALGTACMVWYRSAGLRFVSLAPVHVLLAAAASGTAAHLFCELSLPPSPSRTHQSVGDPPH